MAAARQRHAVRTQSSKDSAKGDRQSRRLDTGIRLAATDCHRQRLRDHRGTCQIAGGPKTGLGTCAGARGTRSESRAGTNVSARRQPL